MPEPGSDRGQVGLRPDRTWLRHSFYTIIEKEDVCKRIKKDKPPQRQRAYQSSPILTPRGMSDPQEHMKGPVSSFMQKLKDGADHNDNTDKERQKHDHKKNATGGDFINK